jgi:hypothetical protein
MAERSKNFWEKLAVIMACLGTVGGLITIIKHNGVTDPDAPKDVFDVKEAIDLLIKQTTAANTLWGIYAAISFTAAGFGITIRSSFPDWAVPISLLAAVGFAAFLIGHWIMLRSPIRVIESVTLELRALQIVPFTRTIKVLLDESYKVRGSGSVHFIIDCCSMGILLISPWVTSMAAATKCC